MKGYSEVEIFDQWCIIAWRAATNLIAALPEDPKFELRCHELARAVYERLLQNCKGVSVVDGRFGGVDHSWISLQQMPRQVILDVYSVGSLPMVQLIALDGSFGILNTRKYVEGDRCSDIDETRVQHLVTAFWQMSP